MKSINSPNSTELKEIDNLAQIEQKTKWNLEIEEFIQKRDKIKERKGVFKVKNKHDICFFYAI